MYSKDTLAPLHSFWILVDENFSGEDHAARNPPLLAEIRRGLLSTA